MSSHHISHIALHVESLRQAARFYIRLFGLEVLRASASRAGENPSPSRTSDGREMPDVDALGDGCLLGRGDFGLALWGDATEAATNGRLAHVGLRIHVDDVEGLRERALSLDCRIAQEDGGCLVVEDVYGIRWHVNADLPGCTGSDSANGR